MGIIRDVLVNWFGLRSDGFCSVMIYVRFHEFQSNVQAFFIFCDLSQTICVRLHQIR